MSELRPAQICPSCGNPLQIDRLRCGCGVVVEGSMRWPRLARLSPDDQQLVEFMILAGGSLKDVAKRLDISYPTIRKRLDNLIKALEAEVQADADLRLRLMRDVETGQKSAGEAAKDLGNT